MKMKKENQIGLKSQEDAFREKAGHYLVCFVDQCPLHDHCLRWLVGQYVDIQPLAYNAINPRNPRIGGEHCEMFRNNQRIVMKSGFRNMYHEMPGYMEYRIRHLLIQTFGRKQYFEMRKGDRLITPEQQEQITAACRYHGWTGSIIYDGEQEDWLW